ncbi:hypothetical protein J1614_009785 [Plenodomus biglobosus]|nr:hypothetical protein J1614_009785 [Plenodomus biglobosus]
MGSALFSGRRLLVPSTTVITKNLLTSRQHSAFASQPKYTHKTSSTSARWARVSFFIVSKYRIRTANVLC